MTELPVFIDMRLAPGPDRDRVTELLAAATAGMGLRIVLEAGKPAQSAGVAGISAADLLVTPDPADACATYTPALAVRDGAFFFAQGWEDPEAMSPEVLRDRLRRIFADHADRSRHVARLWSQIREERLPGLVIRQWYPMLLLLTVGRRIRPHELRPARHAEDGLSAQPDPSPEQIGLLMAKADALANVYGQRYRSAFVGRFILAAVVTVFVALMLFIAPQGRSIAYGVEFVTSFVIIVSFLSATKGDWKGKWLTFRFVSESIRNSLAMGQDSSGHLLQNREYPEDPITDEERLVDWCVRQIVLHDAATTEAQRSERLRGLLTDQIAYHTDRLKTLTRIERRLAGVGFSAFVVTMLLAIGALAMSRLAPDRLDLVMSPVALALGVLPAVGSALFAIRVQSNFNAEALHSNAMIGRLGAILERAGGSSPEAQGWVRARLLAVQKSEFSDWRHVQQGRALDLP